MTPDAGLVIEQAGRIETMGEARALRERRFTQIRV